MTYTYDELLALITQRGIHTEFGDAGEGWGIEQNPHELATFLSRMQELNVTSCLEIGTGYKGGLSRFLAADMGWRVTSVDVVDYGHTFEGVKYHVSEPVFGNFDLAFIDGDHSYPAVRADYNFCAFHATKAIAFHDIAGLRDCKGVQNFWIELQYKYKYQFMESIATEKQSGIGWVEL